MTKEEIEELNGLAASMGLYDDKKPSKRAMILGKAIKALEQQNKQYVSIPIPANATNGDMIKAMFPNLKGGEKAFEIVVTVNKNKVGNISVDWWNAPYKTESEVAE